MADAKLIVMDAGAKGRGVFAAEPITRGARVVACTGRLVRADDLPDAGYAMQVGPDAWLCSDGGATDDYMNHSCEPNVGFSTGKPVLFALRDIAQGEELTWDYATSIDQRGWSLDCGCGAPGCRGTVLPFRELPPAECARLLPTALDYLRVLHGADGRRIIRTALPQ